VIKAVFKFVWKYDITSWHLKEIIRMQIIALYHQIRDDCSENTTQGKQSTAEVLTRKLGRHIFTFLLTNMSLTK